MRMSQHLPSTNTRASFMAGSCLRMPADPCSASCQFMLPFLLLRCCLPLHRPSACKAASSARLAPSSVCPAWPGIAYTCCHSPPAAIHPSASLATQRLVFMAWAVRKHPPRRARNLPGPLPKRRAFAGVCCVAWQPCHQVAHDCTADAGARQLPCHTVGPLIPAPAPVAEPREYQLRHQRQGCHRQQDACLVPRPQHNTYDHLRPLALLPSCRVACGRAQP